MTTKLWTIRRTWPDSEDDQSPRYRGWNLYSDGDIAGVDVRLIDALEYIERHTPPALLRGDEHGLQDD